MHEYSIVQALLGRVEAEAAARGATAVHRLRLKIGEMSGVETPLLRTAYETFTERSICAGAELEIVPVAVSWGCSSCGSELPAGIALRCGDCGGPAKLTAGDEIVLERIEMEVPDV
jgi:hydrogenase nickel incorporation protein HypA/HybF